MIDRRAKPAAARVRRRPALPRALAAAALALLALATTAHARATLRVDLADTLAAFAEALRAARVEVEPPDVPKPAAAAADERLRRVERASEDAPPVGLLSLGRAAGAADRARDFADRSTWLGQDVDSLLWFYGTWLEDRVFALPDTTFGLGIARRVDAVRHVVLVRAQERGLERLRRYEVKYGPGSARLNVLEVLLNAGLQRLSLFAHGENGPSPWEGLLGYTTSYATLDGDDRAVALSALEVGVRHYDFGWTPGATGGFTSHLKPRYWSLGVAIAEERDGALRWPLRGADARRSRVGPFLTWGEIKLAMVLGSEARIAISRQMHVLPNLF